MKTGTVSAFTLIELMVSVMIIVLLAAAGSMALKKHQDRTALDSAVAQLKSAIMETQSYAFAPLSGNDNHYVLVINMSDSSQIYKAYSNGNYSIAAKNYAIYSATDLALDERILIKQVPYSSIPIISSSSSGYVPAYNNNLFIIHFRKVDGVAGCSGNYYNDPNFSTTCSFSNPYAEISLSFASQDKTIKIQKITGEIEI